MNLRSCDFAVDGSPSRSTLISPLHEPTMQQTPQQTTCNVATCDRTDRPIPMPIGHEALQCSARLGVRGLRGAEGRYSRYSTSSGALTVVACHLAAPCASRLPCAQTHSQRSMVPLGRKAECARQCIPNSKHASARLMSSWPKIDGAIDEQSLS